MFEVGVECGDCLLTCWRVRLAVVARHAQHQQLQWTAWHSGLVGGACVYPVCGAQLHKWPYVDMLLAVHAVSCACWDFGNVFTTSCMCLHA